MWHRYEYASTYNLLISTSVWHCTQTHTVAKPCTKFAVIAIARKCIDVTSSTFPSTGTHISRTALTMHHRSIVSLFTQTYFGCREGQPRLSRFVGSAFTQLTRPQASDSEPLSWERCCWSYSIRRRRSHWDQGKRWIGPPFTYCRRGPLTSLSCVQFSRRWPHRITLSTFHLCCVHTSVDNVQGGASGVNLNALYWKELGTSCSTLLILKHSHWIM